ncbi:MAG TPA: SusD/RagB family nutrient-binding outer membrane lipoprotein, partial [Puia sp.]|nr:SusD/RagB family nutrient-binding outer membrane lipoprotein [Puia sp.]
NLFADQYAQYFACEATYFGTDRLVINQAWVGANFNPYYTDVLPQLQTIFANTDSAKPEHAMAEVVWVLTFMKATDYWGPIPYFQAGTVATSVPYDAQDKIYADFFHRLDGAIAILKANAGGNAYGSYDLIYGGSVDKWRKFANTLRLRLALRVSKADPATAKTEAEASVADGVMTTSPDDDGLIKRSSVGGDINGLSTMSDWNEFRMSATMASVLKGYQDPRISQYFLPTVNSGDPTFGKFANYQGLRNGLSVAQLTLSPNLAAANSHQGQRWSSTSVTVGGTVVGEASYTNTPQHVIETAEAYFLRAEGALLGWNMGGTAQSLYETGIKNSMAQWGITDATTVNTYIASANTPIAPGDYLNSPAVSTVPIAWSADPSVELQQIMTQKWLALFPDGMEAWADWRRSHVMKLYPAANSDNQLIPDPSKLWLRRIPFLLTERQNNAAGVQTGVTALGGTDNELTPLWWDKN